MMIFLIAAIGIPMILLIFSRYNRIMNSDIWSIKVFKLDNIVQEVPPENILRQPTIQPSDITDVIAETVADPFLIISGCMFYMFFEVYNKVTEKGELGVATSTDGENWKYEKIILSEKFHLSYPQVFEHRNEMYMIPESIGANKVLLYKARNFPYDWEVAQELIQGKYEDPSIFRYKDKWWMFAGINGQLHLFLSDVLEENWKEHPKSPVISNNLNISRPAGRVIVLEDKIYRYTQDGEPYYGSSVSAFIITKLSEEEYEEEQLNTVLKGTGKENDWRQYGMHHIDQLKLNNKWLVAVDGHRFKKSHYFFWKLDRVISKLHFLAKSWRL